MGALSVHPSVADGRIDRLDQQMINLPDVRYSFDAEVRAAVRRNLASGVYDPAVAYAAVRWLDDQQEQAAARARGMTVHQHILARQVVAAATAAAVCSFLTVVLVLFDLHLRH